MKFHKCIYNFNIIVKDNIKDANVYLPNLPREPTDFVSILSFPYTNKKNYHLNKNTSNNIQQFSSILKKKQDINNKNDQLNNNNNNISYKLDSNYRLWNQLPNKKTFLTVKLL